MRGIKAALLFSILALIGWALINLGQMILAEYPLYTVWQLGAAVACLYCLGDMIDRSREWLGRGGERRPYRQAWRGWR